MKTPHINTHHMETSSALLALCEGNPLLGDLLHRRDPTLFSQPEEAKVLKQQQQQQQQQINSQNNRDTGALDAIAPMWHTKTVLINLLVRIGVIDTHQWWARVQIKKISIITWTQWIVYSMRPIDAYLNQSTRPPFVQIMSCCLLCTKALSWPILACCWLHYTLRNLFIWGTCFIEIVSRN